MKFEIKRAKNGWILKTHDGEEWVGQEVHDDEMSCFVSFLREVELNFGPIESHSRYSKERIHIVLIPGDKCEEQLDHEYINGLTELRDHLNFILEEQKIKLEEKLRKVQ